MPAGNKKKTKEATITIRIDDEWDAYLTEVAEKLSVDRDQECSKTWVVTQLMKFGKDGFEKKHGIVSKKKIAS